MIVPHGQPPKNVEDEVAIGDDTTMVIQGVRHALHLAIVVANREATLDKVAEHGIEVKHTCFIVVNGLEFDHAPDLACGDTMLLGDVLKLTGDHAKDLGEDDTIHALPGRVIDGRGIREDVVGEIVVLQGEQNLIALAGIACRRRIQNSQDKGANDLYCTGLHV
jgi:hypothetical protein